MDNKSDKSVLLCDDSAYSRSQVKRLLNEHNLTNVIEAEDAQAGFAKYKEHKPTIVIMDLILRGSKGHEAIKLIRDYDPDSKILVLTILTDEDELHQVRELGIENIINKKDMRSDLIPTINKMI